MGINQITASKTDLLLQCPRPFQEATEISGEGPGEEAEYGTRVHLELAGGDSGGPKAKAHAAEANGVLERWMGASVNPLGVDLTVASQEASKALLSTGLSADATLDLETHTYSKKAKGAVVIWGTSDVVLTGKRPAAESVLGEEEAYRIVLDLKTGAYNPKFESPKRLGQMRTLALLEDATHVGIIHAHAGQIPTIYLDEINKEEKGAHEAELCRARARVRRPDYQGFLRTGSECRYCPAKEGCPARMADLVPLAGGLVKAMTGARLAAHVDRAKFLEGTSPLLTLIKAAREEIKEEVREGLVVENSKGKTYQISTVARENLSKASVIRALGETRGELELDRLRGLGAVETLEYEELRAK